MKLTTAQVVAKRDAASAAGNWDLAEEYEAELERRDAELEALREFTARRNEGGNSHG